MDTVGLPWVVRLWPDEMKKLGNFIGKDVTGTICAHPLRGQGYDYDVPCHMADYVTDENGTGFVHVALRSVKSVRLRWQLVVVHLGATGFGRLPRHSL